MSKLKVKKKVQTAKAVKKHLKADIKTFKHEISDDKKLLQEIKQK